jgi:undecaprenyl pyrophosphate phosphatase UppP
LGGEDQGGFEHAGGGSGEVGSGGSECRREVIEMLVALVIGFAVVLFAVDWLVEVINRDWTRLP